MQIPEGAETVAPRYNIAPTQPIAVLANDGKNTLDYFVWGLIPSWAKDPSIANKLINARSETLAEKPSFRAAFKRRRCLIFADGFYEWVQEPGIKSKTPYYIQLESQDPFGIAGLWEIWVAPDGSEVKTATIVTTEPNPKIAKLHNRMPVILPEKQIETWLDPADGDPVVLNSLLVPYPAEEMTFYPVSRTVNNPGNETPDCILPA
jgi:putative SOS response-associated peptidase YedK